MAFGNCYAEYSCCSEWLRAREEVGRSEVLEGNTMDVKRRIGGLGREYVSLGCCLRWDTRLEPTSYSTRTGSNFGRSSRREMASVEHEFQVVDCAVHLLDYRIGEEERRILPSSIRAIRECRLDSMK